MIYSLTIVINIEINMELHWCCWSWMKIIITLKSFSCCCEKETNFDGRQKNEIIIIALYYMCDILYVCMHKFLVVCFCSLLLFFIVCTAFDLFALLFCGRNRGWDWGGFSVYTLDLNAISELGFNRL